MRFQLSRVAWGRYYAAKDIKFGVEARVFDVEDLVDAVKVTMGPKRLKFDKPLGVKGHNVVLEHLKLQKTGATVARNIDFKDKVKIVGASLVNQVANASATNDVAGDGSTCARVMTRAIFVEGCKSIAAGMNAIDLGRGITMAVDDEVTNSIEQSKDDQYI